MPDGSVPYIAGEPVEYPREDVEYDENCDNDSDDVEDEMDIDKFYDSIERRSYDVSKKTDSSDILPSRRWKILTCALCLQAEVWAISCIIISPSVPANVLYRILKMYTLTQQEVQDHERVYLTNELISRRMCLVVSA